MIVEGIDVGPYWGKSSVHVTYQGVNGETVTLWGPGFGDEGVILMESGPRGLSAKPDLTVQQSVNRFGGRQAGFRLPPLSGSLNVLLCEFLPHHMLADVLRDWRRAWSPLADGVLKVDHENGGNFFTRARLDSVPDDPENDPNWVSGFEESLSWIGLDGCWFGAPRHFEGNVTVTPSGDLSPKVEVLWPAGVTGALSGPGVSMSPQHAVSNRVINLDRGMGGRVTFADENWRDTDATDTITWSSFRGMVHGISLTPGKPTEWSLPAGVRLRLSERYLSPWG